MKRAKQQLKQTTVGNGEMPLNVGCQNTASQIQGDYNSAALESEQEFEEEELMVPAPTP